MRNIQTLGLVSKICKHISENNWHKIFVWHEQNKTKLMLTVLIIILIKIKNNKRKIIITIIIIISEKYHTEDTEKDVSAQNSNQRQPRPAKELQKNVTKKIKSKKLIAYCYLYTV